MLLHNARRTTDRACRRGDAHAPRRSMSWRAVAMVVVYLVAFATSTVCAIGIDDIPPNDDRRTLSRFRFPRVYPLTDAEIRGMSVDDVKTLTEYPYGLLAFRSADVRDENVKRIVIMMHGQGRDGWLYQNQAVEALDIATDATTTVQRSAALRRDLAKLNKSETLIVSPQFINDEDEELAARTNELSFDHVDELSKADPSQTMLQWQGNSWALGGDSIAPVEVTSKNGGKRRVRAPPVSAFEAIDAMIASMADGKTFPRLQTIVVAGHSLGAQFVQRYALIGAVPSRSVPVHFFVANAGSFAYLTPERPRPTSACADSYDTWKFGLSVFGIRYLYDTVIESLDSASDVTDVRVRYLRDRRVHYLFGLNDTAPSGDRGCAAMTQGRFHLERGRNFAAHVNATAAALHVRHGHTVDYVADVAHDALGIFTASSGVRRLFLANIDGNETVRGVGYADADAFRYPYRFSAAVCLRDDAALASLLRIVFCAFLATSFLVTLL